jgi:protein-L-isoaspartate(D-aspartate) O-methyltransferase
MKRYCFLVLAVVLAGLTGGKGFGFTEEAYRIRRQSMVEEIKQDVLRTSRHIRKTRLNEAVMNAMAEVPRHEFVPRKLRKAAYENRPLPIGYGQTISQPYIVALMTDLLKISPTDAVLEVGTGSGYQAAILAELAKKVYTIEIIKELGEQARQRLKNLGYANVDARIGDGYYGLKKEAPFDAIVVTAAAGHIPPPLTRQLKPGGRMVIPVGGAFMTQQLILIEKLPDGRITTRQLLPVRFVPLTGGH